jgi:hypothetical protein
MIRCRSGSSPRPRALRVAAVADDRWDAFVLVDMHSTWTREVNRGSVRARVKSSPDAGQLHCGSWPGPRLEQAHGGKAGIWLRRAEVLRPVVIALYAAQERSV